MVKVFMISRDASALDPKSDTAGRLRLLGEKGADLTVAVFASAKRDRISQGDSISSPSVRGYSGGFFRQSWKIFLLGKKLVKKDWLVTSQDPFEAGLLAYLIARRAGAALELQLHGDFFGHYWRREVWHRPFRLIMARWLLRRADSVRVPSSRVARSLSGIIAPERIVAVPVSAGAVVRGPVPARPTILFAGRFSREKNLAMLIEAFRLLRQAVPAALLVLRGDGPERKKLEDLARAVNRAVGEENAVSFRPLVAAGEGVVDEATVCALSSNHESWSRFAVSAAASGCPVVMTDVGCAGEVIKNGESGWVVPVGDAKTLADSLVEAITNPAEAARRAAAAAEAAQALPGRGELAERIVGSWRRLAGGANDES